MKNIEVKKVGATKKEAPIKKTDKKKTDSEIFLEECDTEQAEIFEDIKSALMAKGKGNKHEFEAVNAKRFDDFALLIEYVINGIVLIEDDGIRVNLRQPLENSEGVEITDNIKVLFARNESRETVYRKSVKTPERSKDYDNDMGMAVIAASFADVDNKPLSTGLFHILKNTNPTDYALIVKIYGFFRN